MKRPPLPPEERKIAIGLFLLAAVVYGWFFGGGGWNQNAQFALTRAIVERHSFSIDPWAGSTGDRSFHGGHVYANKAPGTSFLAAIPYFVVSKLERGADLQDVYTQILNSYLCTVVTSGLLGALIAPMIFFFGRRFVGASSFASAAVALVIVFGTPFFPFSTLLFAHVPSASLLFLGYLLAREENPRTFLAGLAAGLAALTNYVLLPLTLVTILPILVGRESKRGRQVLVTLAGIALPLLALAYYQWRAFGSPLRTSISTMDERFASQHAWLGIIGPPSADAAWGITFSPYRGLFYLSPILLIAVAGLLVMASQRRFLDLAAAGGVTVFLFVFNVTFNGWEGGFSIGPRYLIPAIPFLGIALLYCRRFSKTLLVLAATVSLFFNFAATAVDPQPSGTIPRPLTQYIVPLLLTGQFSPSVPITAPWSASTIRGHISVNPLTPDEAVPFTLHPAGSGPSLWASFNVGEALFGVGSVWSIVPIALLLLCGAGLLLARAKGRSA